MSSDASEPIKQDRPFEDLKVYLDKHPSSQEIRGLLADIRDQFETILKLGNKLQAGLDKGTMPSNFDLIKISLAIDLINSFRTKLHDYTHKNSAPLNAPDPISSLNHTIANYAGITIGNANLIQYTPKKSPVFLVKAPGYLTAIRDAAQAVLKHLSFLTENTSEPAGILVMNDFISRNEGVLKGMLGERSEEIKFACIPFPKPCYLMADENSLLTILTNLVKNAAEAMPADRENPQITLSIFPSEFNEDDQAPASPFSPHPCVILSVVDNGKGMDEETQKRIFEEGFTTKNGEGHGIGLAHVRQLVQALKGHIRVVSVPGEGTVFEICLPACNQEVCAMK